VRLIVGYDRREMIDDDHEVEPGCCPAPGDLRRAEMKRPADPALWRIRCWTLRRSIGTSNVMRMQRDERLRRDLAAFFREHRHCGELNAGVEGERVWATCSCGALLE